MPVNVSVILTTKNEEKHIASCLESIRRQDCPASDVEVIVVDNYSTDKTTEIASGYTRKIFTKGPERSTQRNFGVLQAQGTYILYLDADMRLSEHVISECLSKCAQDKLIALYIPERIIGEGFWIKVRNFERSFYNTTCIDGVRFIRKDKFQEAGGFDESFNEGEDWDLNRRIEALGKVGLIQSSLFHDEGRFNLRKYLTKKGRYAEKLDGYISKWGKDDPIVKKQIGFFYRYLGVFMEKGKFLKLLRHPALTLGMYLLRIMVGITYLNVKRHNYGH